MSSSDIRDILQINNSSKEFIQKKPKQTVEKRPGFFFFLKCGFIMTKLTLFLDGISRELYQLIGGAPPVAFVKPTFKTKLQNKQRATPW